MKHIILGDVHLGRSLNIGKPAAGKTLNSRVCDQLALLKWVKEQALKHNSQHIVITGDVFQDPRPHPAIINYLVEWLKECKEENINVSIVGGNHDFIRNGNYVLSALDLIPIIDFEGISVYKDPESFIFNKVCFTFVPFRDKRMYEVKETSEALVKLKEEIREKTKQDQSLMNVLVGHLSLDKSLSVGDEISDQSNEIFVPLDFFDDFNLDYVWMGHIHHYQVLKEENPHISHIGSMDRSDFSANEIDKDKYIVLLDDEDKNFELLRIPTRSLIKEKVSVPVDQEPTDFVINELCLKNKKTSFKDSIFRLEVELNSSDSLNIDRERVFDYLYNNLEVHHVPNISEFRVLAQVDSSDVLFDSSIDDTKADIKKYLESHADDFENDLEKNLFLEFANRCVDKLENGSV